MAGVAVVLGCGRGVWDDLHAIRARVTNPVIFAVNYMLLLEPTVHHGVSHHAEELPAMMALRGWGIARGSRAPVVTHASVPGPGVDHVWPQFHSGPSGSSSLLAARIALALGHEAVILAGVPLDAGGYVWGDPHAAALARDYTCYRQGWEAAVPTLAGRVTALRGYLADLLGRPALVPQPACAEAA